MIYIGFSSALACTGMTLCLLIAAHAGAATLSPPMWWVGMETSKLQLMIEEKDIGSASVTTAYPGVSVEKVSPSSNPDFLFVELQIAPDTVPGNLVLNVVGKGQDERSLNYALLKREKGSAARIGFNSEDAIYLLTPDRFANGEPANDSIADFTEGLHRDSKGGRHGGDIAGIVEHLDYISDMGFTQIWAMPMLENAMDSYSYHGYAITDHYQIDPRFGSNEAYRALSMAARRQGMGMIMDMVLNHIGSEHPWMQSAPDANWIHHDGKFSATTHVREAMHDIHGSEFDKAAFNDGWFVPAMPDLNQGNDKLATYLIQNAIWWVEYAGLSGIRVDTYSYSEKAFLSEWTRRLLTEYPHLNIVGEEWSVNPVITSYWQAGTLRRDGYASWLPSVMDFPLQDALIKAINEDEGWGTGLSKLYNILAGDFIYGDPSNLVIFADNHDMSRIFTQVDHDLEKWKMAMAVILTTRGIPQVFYGTEILMDNPGTDDHGVIRSDFPGGWEGDTVNGFSGKGLNENQSEAQQFMRLLLHLRQQYPLLFSGELTHYAPVDGTYVYFRHATKTNNQIMVIINKDDNKTLDLQRFTERLTQNSTVRMLGAGQAEPLKSTLAIPGHQASVWVLNE